MPKFIFWYKKEIDARDIRQAVLKENATTPEFSSMEQVIEKHEEISQGTPAIGFFLEEEQLDD